MLLLLFRGHDTGTPPVGPTLDNRGVSGNPTRDRAVSGNPTRNRSVVGVASKNSSVTGRPPNP